MFTEKKRRIFSIIAFIAFILFMFGIGWFIGRPIVKFVSEPDKFRAWVDTGGFMSRVYFVLMVAFQVVVALVPGEPLEIGAGYAFGAIEGSFLCLIGIGIGSFIVFALVKKFGIKLIEVFFSIEKIKSLKFLQNQKKVAAIIFLMFFLPGTPKDLLTYCVGITNISIKQFAIISTVARIPSVITSTIGGSLLGTKKYIFAIIVFAITFIISIFGWLIYNNIARKNQTEE